MKVLSVILNILASISSIALFITLCINGEVFPAICAFTLATYFAFETVRHVIDIKERKSGST